MESLIEGQSIGGAKDGYVREIESNGTVRAGFW